MLCTHVLTNSCQSTFEEHYQNTPYEIISYFCHVKNNTETNSCYYSLAAGGIVQKKKESTYMKTTNKRKQ